MRWNVLIFFEKLYDAWCRLYQIFFTISIGYATHNYITKVLCCQETLRCTLLCRDLVARTSFLIGFQTPPPHPKKMGREVRYTRNVAFGIKYFLVFNFPRDIFHNQLNTVMYIIDVLSPLLKENNGIHETLRRCVMLKRKYSTMESLMKFFNHAYWNEKAYR